MSIEALAEDLAALSTDPHRFVMWAFPWGEAGSELERFKGPESWQVSILCDIRDGLLSPNEAIRLATASGHGVGKSALVAWIIIWAISTMVDTRGVVTANTETQLKTKTWAELGKWHRLFIGRDLFSMTATALFHKDRERTWRIDMVAWSEKNTEAFAGMHNQGRRVLLVMDEASAIPDIIWEVAEGALTDADTQIIWAVFGNPTRNTGRFAETFPGGRFGKYWKHHQVDSRTVSFTNKSLFQQWIDAYGEDSDFVRVRVRGVLPRTGEMEFISAAAVSDACSRVLESHPADPIILGVDVARFGDDESVIYIRQGLDGRSYPPRRFRGLDTVALAGQVAAAQLELGADAIFVDEGGVGGGVVDQLRQLRVNCIGINFGSKPTHTNFVSGDEGTKYANKRAEMWGAMRSWLDLGSLPDLPDLRAQLVGPTYGFNNQMAIQLERKEDMKKRGLESPDLADALALTFALPVGPRQRASALARDPSTDIGSYDPFSPKHMEAV